MIDEFTVTEDHLKLLRHAYIGWSDVEYGAPAVDPKRPYGNSYVLDDLAEILIPGWSSLSDIDQDRELDAEGERLERLHRETETVLQIAVSVGRFEAGRYRQVRFGQWAPADETRGETTDG